MTRRALRGAVFGALLAVAVEAIAPVIAFAEPDVVGGGVASFSGWAWFGLLLRLGLVLGTIWAAVMAMRWYVRRVNGDGGQLGRQLQVLESRSLGPNRALHLVSLNGRAVLLGVTAERINSLLTIDDAEEVERLVTAATNTNRSPLRQMTSGFTGLASARMGTSLRGLFATMRAAGQPQARRPRPDGRSASIPGTATQRARAAAAYGGESTIAAAQQAIAQARGERA